MDVHGVSESRVTNGSGAKTEIVGIEGLTRFVTGKEATDWMLPLFWSLARRMHNIGEIGMRGGTSTLAFLMGAAEVGGHVYSIDVNPCEHGLEVIRNAGLDHWHTFIHGDSTEKTFPSCLDLLFIDGDHSYRGVSTDFFRHRPRMNPGGLILLHDTQSDPDVGRFCNDHGIFRIPLGAGLGIYTC